MGKTPPDESGVIACLIKKCLGIIMRNLIIAGLWAIATLPVPSLAAPYPVVAEIQTILLGATAREYHVRYELMDIPGADIPIPPGTLVGSAHRHYFNGRYQVSMPGYSTPGACSGVSKCLGYSKPGENLSDAVTRIFSQIGNVTVGAIPHSNGNAPNPPPGSECVAFVGGQDGQLWSTAIMPPGTCIVAPPGKDLCNIVTPLVVLDHGVISVRDASPSRADRELVVDCTAPMTVTLVFGTDVVRLGSGVESHLSVVGLPSDGGLPLQSGSNTVTLRSELVTSGPAAGEYMGSTVLSISYL